MDELFDSNIKFAYDPFYHHVFKYGDETEAFKILRNSVDFSLIRVCLEWVMYQKNMSIIFSESFAEIMYTNWFCLVRTLNLC
jgi:hypothetical protein